MNVTKISNINFQKKYSKNKNINTGKTYYKKHTNRKKIPLLGIAVAIGVIALLVKNKKIKMPDFIKNYFDCKKIDFKKSGTIENNYTKICQNQAPLQKDIELKDTPTEGMLNKTHVVSEKETAKTTEVIEEAKKTNIDKQEAITPETEVKPDTTQEVVTTEPDNKGQASNDAKATNPETKQLFFEKEIAVNPDYLEKVKTLNQEHVARVISESPKLFDDFGISERILSEFNKLDPNLVREIDEPEFLSLILAPTDKIMITQRELEDSATAGVNELFKGIFDKKGQKQAKRIQGRKFALHSIAKNINPEIIRIKRLNEMQEKFTPEDISKIFNDSTRIPRKALLSWLLEFNNLNHSNSKLDKLMWYLNKG